MAGPTGSEQAPSATSRRRLAVWLCVGFGVAMLLAGVIVSLVTGTLFQWGPMLLILSITGFLFGGFVYIRLAAE